MSDREVTAGENGVAADPGLVIGELNAERRRAARIEAAARWVVECPRAQRDEAIGRLRSAVEGEAK